MSYSDPGKGSATYDSFHYKHLLAMSLATPCLPVDFLIVKNLEYALCAIFTVVLGQLSTAVTYEAAFNHR